MATTLQQAQSSRNPQTVSGSFSDDLLGSLGRGKRRRGGFAPTVRLPTNQAVPLGELVERAESEPEGRGWGRGLRGLAEGGVNPDDVAEALAGGRELYGSDGGERGGIDGLDSPYNGRSFSNLNGTEVRKKKILSLVGS